MSEFNEHVLYLTGNGAEINCSDHECRCDDSVILEFGRFTPSELNAALSEHRQANRKAE